jgi:hypothetical protein
MKINLAPNLDQIRFYAKSALHAWDYQDLESGRAQVVADMQALLSYLDTLNDGEGVAVASVSRIKAGVRIERSTREGDFFDLVDRYISQNIEFHIDSRDCGDACPGMVKDSVRTESVSGVVDRHDDLGTVVSRPTQR